MVDTAVRLSRTGGLADRVLRELRGRRLDESVPLRAALSHASLGDVRRRTSPRPSTGRRSAARVVPLGDEATHRPVARRRRGAPRAAPAHARASLLRARTAPRSLAVPTRVVHPRWSTASIAKRYPTFILVSRETFTLRLFKHLKLARTFRIAVGQAGLETPAGLYTINDKQMNPSWHVPLSAWAGDLAGRIIPPGPADPIKARWMGFWDGAGIHGTDEISLDRLGGVARLHPDDDPRRRGALSARPAAHSDLRRLTSTRRRRSPP